MKILILLVVSFPALLQAENLRFAVEDQQAALAACQPSIPSTQEMELRLREKFPSDVSSPSLRDETIMGVSFKQQNVALLEIFRKLITPQKSFGQTGITPMYVDSVQNLLLKRENGELLPYLNSKKKYNFKTLIPANCSDVFCAVKAIFGNEQAIKIMWLKTMYGANASQFSGHHLLGTEYVTAWTNEDLDILIKAFSMLPSHFDLRPRISSVSMLKEELDVPGNRHVYANSTMLFGSLWRLELPSGTKESVVFHELAHNLIYLLGLENGDYTHTKWLVITGWNNLLPKDFASVYAKENASEDLAETITAYRYTPERLKRVSAARYEFVKEHIFNRKEFIRPEDCE